MLFFAIVAMIAYLLSLYLGAVAWILPQKRNEKTVHTAKVSPKSVAVVGSFACVLHFVNISQLLMASDGQNFTLDNVASLISLLMSLIATVALPRWKTVWFPVMIIYTLGVITVATSNFVAGSVIKHLSENVGLLAHLAFALISYALFFIALLYAFQRRWLDRKLKNKEFSPNLPALMTVERHFFNLTLVAQALLTLALMTGMFYLHNFFANEHIHKAIFSSGAWVVYSVLLLGQWKLRWRGNRVLIYSLSGMILLSFAYFGSRLV